MILVFGKTGQVATELQNFKAIVSLGREQANLANPIKCYEIIKNYQPTAVINAAAYTSVDEAENDVTLVNTLNCTAPSAMATACAELDIPLVHISTDYVFDGTGTKPWSVNDRPNPQNTYGNSKLAGEAAIVASGCIHAILRTSWVFSPHGKNFVKSMLRLSKLHGNLNIVDDQIGGPTYAKDIARTCLSIAEQLITDPRKSGIYHYSGHPDVSWSQFANEIFDLTGRNTIVKSVPTCEYPTVARRPLNSKLNCSLTREIFDINRPLWKDGLIETLKKLEGEK